MKLIMHSSYRAQVTVLCNVGGATAIIASQQNPLPPWAGFSFVIVVLVASSGMTLIAMITNNFHYKKRYPTFWFGYRKPVIGIQWK